MSSSGLLFSDPASEVAKRRLLKIEPRDYQVEAHDNCFRLWDSGTVGTLIRAATGTGKSAIATMLCHTWLARGDNRRCMILSYEKQLVWQFAQEIEDLLGITPEVEMQDESVERGRIPPIVVCSRQTLMKHPLAREDEQYIAAFATFGIDKDTLGVCPKIKAKGLLSALVDDVDKGVVLNELLQINEHWMANHHAGAWSRLWKFDWQYDWLIVPDEAHKWSHRLTTVGHLIDWFDRNPNSRRAGITATPKRSDRVSIGDKMFPGIALDYPLWRPEGRCAVRDGFAVPYVQRFIEVEGVDFKQLKKVAGDFDENELERVLGHEKMIAKLVEPLLDMAGDRSTLIFNPGVQMARDVADYINARCACQCSCGKRKWFPKLLIGDGAKCDCGVLLSTEHVVKDGNQATAVWGELHPQQRREIYRGHNTGAFQFLSVCGLCIAEGTLILTDKGEIPIQNVTSDMRLWDGVEFVSHGGVISQGRRPVITHAGLTATGDHNVWTAAGWKSLAECQRTGLAIAVAGIGGHPMREIDRHYRTDDLPRESAASRSAMRGLPEDNVAAVLPLSSGEVLVSSVLLSSSQSERHSAGLVSTTERPHFLRQTPGSHRRHYQGRSVAARRTRSSMRGLRTSSDKSTGGFTKWASWVQKLFKAFWHSAMAALSLSRSNAEMHKSVECRLPGLWWPRYRNGLLVIASNGTVDHGESWIAEGFDNRPDRQQRQLRAWQHQIRNTDTAGQQQKAPQIVEVYDILNAGPRNRFTANGLIVSNCKEGYNSPDISCVAIFRPVSKAASSLAEQLKGRGCRTARGVIDGLKTPEERLAAIAASSKPNCSVIDLCGITGLADCASTVLIYADGLPDEVKQKAEEMLEEAAKDEDKPEVNIEELIGRATQLVEDEKTRIKEEREAAQRQSREEAERRSKAQAEVTYSTHEVGMTVAGDPRLASEGQYKFLAQLGMTFHGIDVTKKQAGRMIRQLMVFTPPEDVAYACGIRSEHWEKTTPSAKQLGCLKRNGVTCQATATPYEASLLISAIKEPELCEKRVVEAIASAQSHEELTAVATRAAMVRRFLREKFDSIVRKGAERRKSFSSSEEF